MVLQYSSYNIPISVGLKLWMHVLWMMAGECTFKFLLMNPSDWLALAVMVLICLSHFKLFWMVMPKYFAESTFSSVCPCNWYGYEIVFCFCVTLRDRPFNLQGGCGYGILFRSEFFFRTTQELEYFFFCRAKLEIFFQTLTLGYMTKTLNQIIFFFLHQNQNIFFSIIGNQNIFFRKKS
jgi:hypothetical protein